MEPSRNIASSIPAPAGALNLKPSRFVDVSVERWMLPSRRTSIVSTSVRLVPWGLDRATEGSSAVTKTSNPQAVCERLVSQEVVIFHWPPAAYSTKTPTP